MKLLDSAQKKKFEGAEEVEKLVCETLWYIFKEINTKRELGEFNPQNLANIANDAVKLLDYAQKNKFEGAEEFEKLARETLDCIFQEVIKRKNLGEFNPQDLSNKANALVQAGYWNDTTSELLEKIGKNVCKRKFNTFNSQNICNLAWSFAVGKKELFIRDWLIEGISLTLQEFSALVTMEQSWQLYLAFLRQALDERKWTKEDPDAFLTTYLSEDLAKKILPEVREEVASKDVKKTKFQHNVGNALRQILPKSYTLKEKYYIKPYPVDFVILKDEKLIAIIEANGPTHFMCNGNYNLRHEFKETLLKDMGYANIINIDYCEWYDSKNQKSILSQKLSKILELNSKTKIVINDDSSMLGNIIVK